MANNQAGSSAPQCGESRNDEGSATAEYSARQGDRNRYSATCCGNRWQPGETGKFDTRG